MGDTSVWARVDLPGFHCWPQAPARRDYLRDRHRHLFRIVVTAAVRNDDRDVEFHDLQERVRSYWGVSIPDWGAASCEQIARHLGEFLLSEGLPITSVGVSEDDENGATVQFGAR